MSAISSVACAGMEEDSTYNIVFTRLKWIQFLQPMLLQVKKKELINNLTFIIWDSRLKEQVVSPETFTERRSRAEGEISLYI